MIRAIALLGAIAAAPAFAQTGDLSVAVGLSNSAGDGFSTDTLKPFVSGGSSKRLLAQITNNGPSKAEGVTLTITVPPGEAFTGAPANCTATESDADEAPVALTCDVGEVIDFTKANVTFSVVASPTRLTACPAADAVYPIAVTVAASADPNPANNTATLATGVVPPASLEPSISGPATAGVGTQFAYTVTITNTGLCPAENVTYLIDTPNTMLTFDGDSLGSDAAATSGCTDNSEVSCNVSPSIAPGESATFQIKYTPNALQNETKTGGTVRLTHGLTASSDNSPDGSTSIVTPLTYPAGGGGCSSGGGAGVAGLGLALAALVLKRRKRS